MLSRLTLRSCAVASALLLLPPGPAAAGDGRAQPEGHLIAERDGRLLRYTAQAGFLVVPGPDAGSSARMFYTAYASPQPVATERKRPVVFAFNGGPGGSSAGVHIGAFGPRVVAPVEPGRSLDVSDRLIDNPDTLLKDADLVFVDPVGSGLSRVSPGTDPASFYGVRPDATATASFIVSYLRGHADIDRPFFILGESYGTLRTVLTARLLQHQGCKPAGLVLMGLILDNATLFAQPGDDEPYWLFLPSEAATAHFHGRAGVGAPLAAVVTSAERFATDCYLVALTKGSALSPAARKETARTLGELSGLDTDDIRIGPDRFARELLGGELTLSRADGRFAGSGGGDAGPLADPLYRAMLPAYGRAITRYLQDELGVVTGETYRVLDPSVADAWRWGDTPLGSPTALSVGGALRDALHADPDLAVFVASGVYDLTSPMLAADYTLAHLGTAPEELARITSRRYESGHMIYVSAQARQALAHDVAAFIHARGGARPLAGGA